MSLADAVRAAYDRRAALHAGDLDCYRLLHGWDEDVPGVEIDRYGDAAVIELKPDAVDVAELTAALDACRRFDRVVVRPRPGAPRALRGQLGRVEVSEHGLRFAIDLGRAGNPGLYLDARPARAWIRAHAAGRRVLNLFAFSGSLGVAAAVGGARSVLHIDATQPALDWCRTNHALNGVPLDDRSLARMNVYQHLRKGAAGRQRFGAIVVDPPPGPEVARADDRTPGGRGPLALVDRLVGMLEPGGWLLVFLHHGIRSVEEAEAEIIAAGAARGIACVPLWRGTSGDDFPERDPTRKLGLVAVRRAEL